MVWLLLLSHKRGQSNLRVLHLLIIFALLFGFTGQSRSQEELFIGTRPMGLSGAFTAIADDAHAVTWNPAGITQLNQQELTTMWTNLFNSGVIQSYLGMYYRLQIN